MSNRDVLNWSVVAQGLNNKELAQFILSDLLYYKGEGKPNFDSDMRNMVALLDMLRPQPDPAP